MPRSFDPPPRLRRGAHVRIIAPSSPFPRDDFERGLERLRARYRVSFDDDVFATSGYLAGDDRRRLAELERALTEPGIDAIVAARGGYGAMRLLPSIDVDRIRKANRVLIGFSDVTALTSAWARAGLRSIHGAMVAGLGRAHPEHVDRWLAIAEGAEPRPVSGLTRLVDGDAEGPLIGGNLALLAALVGTPYAPPSEGAIVVIEDVGEAPYRVDRMLTTLRLAGWLQRAAAIVVADFRGCGPRSDGRTVEEAIADRVSDLGLPVATGLSSGHCDDNLELPLGARVSLSRDTLTFLEPAVE